MLDSNIELYGPYVLEGKELLNPRTEKEKEKLKRKPKNWRLACQTVVGEADSTGVVVIQQLPEWKGHEWKYEK
ncbi:electron carrier/ electron transporter/ iron ion binding protein, partial [Trifolium medium]|nr:electron carrier/ electron transporter/ iron ion binding protein [Trifolium medium]